MFIFIHNTTQVTLLWGLLHESWRKCEAAIWQGRKGWQNIGYDKFPAWHISLLLIWTGCNYRSQVQGGCLVPEVSCWAGCTFLVVREKGEERGKNVFWFMYSWALFTHILIYLVSTTWGWKLWCLVLFCISHPIPIPMMRFLWLTPSFCSFTGRKFPIHKH